TVEAAPFRTSFGALGVTLYSPDCTYEGGCYRDLGMPNILFILLLALVIFGPRKLPEIVTNILPKGQPWERLMSLMTKSVSPGSQELVSISESSAEQPKLTPAPVEPLSSLAK